MGVSEQIIFPEIDYDTIDQVRGMDITICTSAPSDEEARGLLKAMGMPFPHRVARRAFDPRPTRPRRRPAPLPTPRGSGRGAQGASYQARQKSPKGVKAGARGRGTAS